MIEKTPPSVTETIKAMSSRELGKIKVFIVEDNQMISELVATKLIQNGCIPYSTSDGLQAIALAKQYMPNVIILDLMLPGMKGEEILTEIRKSEELKLIPVVVFTNKSQETDKQRLTALGADRFFVKSLTDLNELVSDLKTLTHTRN